MEKIRASVAPYGAEAVQTGDADYYINARELYRIFLRCGVNPALRKGEKAEKVADFERCTRYSALFAATGWDMNAKAEELSFSENGREYKALICRNLGLAAKALESMDKYDIIKFIG